MMTDKEFDTFLTTLSELVDDNQEATATQLVEEHIMSFFDPISCPRLTIARADAIRDTFPNIDDLSGFVHTAISESVSDALCELE